MPSAALFRTFSLVICARLVISASNPSSDTPVVHTDHGPILGRKLTLPARHVDAFYGIPFAEPPVGKLRFQKPVPAKPWKGIYNATEKPKPCWQYDVPYSTITLNYLNASISSEDCLFLNVWRPSSVCSQSGECDTKLPVVVYIYGGGFQIGDSSLFLSDPANFVSLSDVIYVTMNHRMGVLGFLASGRKELPGNLGLWDQNLALKWVRDNIGQFGGNPNHITLSGFSSGAISAGLHAISPHSQKLFSRLILQSSTPLSLAVGLTAAGAGKFLNVAGALDCFTGEKDWSNNFNKIVTCLQKPDAETIYRTLKKGDPINQFFSPVYGDEFLPDDIRSKEIWKSLSTKEILLGSTSDEGSYFLDFLKSQVPQLTQVLSIDYRLAGTVAISTLLDAPFARAKQIVHAYFGDDSVEHDETSLNSILEDIFGDVVVDCPTILFGEVAAELGIKAYRYIFAHRPSYSIWPKSFGPTHNDDLAFTLGYLPFINDTSRFTPPLGEGVRKILRGIRYTQDELDFMKELIGTWTSFIETGKPSIPSSTTEWPRFSASNPECIYLRPHNYTRALTPRRDICELWRPLLLRESSQQNEE
ncbi:acetylcholinesterase-1 [Ixodes scapularis]|uniref:acetylcholinesterase-1 n=1 Tax=Ixodes scapularis TaxID=6945 RepID=UPI001C387433|nr:acetylcholinesterase-1 [Ixodes scapularis]